mmetsp:Transcript_21993/g.61529  ORF Transcript_21993/g.61529 Transcript_21993/m.61529 type:complete len:493 (-) Transcript_21993:46-1524(-)
MSADLPIPSEDIWGSTLSLLHVKELASVAPASRLVLACVGTVVSSALGHVSPHLLGARRAKAWRPPVGIGWVESFRRAVEWPRLAVLGGEDARDEPLLPISLVCLGGDMTSVNGRAMSTSPCSLPSGRYRLSASQVGLTVYVTGGVGPEGDQCLDVLRMDALTHRWDSGAPQPEPMPTPRYGHESVCVFDRYLLCIGGKAAGCPAGGSEEDAKRRDAEVGGSTDCLDVESGRWLTLPCRLASPRVYFGAAVVGNVVVVCGGAALGRSAGASEGRLASTELLDVSQLHYFFDEATDAYSSSAKAEVASSWRWQTGPRLLFPRYDFSLAGPIDGLLFAVGGSGARRLVEVLDALEVAAWLRQPGGPPQLGANAQHPQLQRREPEEMQAYERRAASPDVQQQLLTEGWADVHAHTPPSGLAGGTSIAPQWSLHPVELPDSRSCGNTAAVGNSLYLVGGSQRCILHYTIGAPAWECAPVELDSMRLGAKALALGAA